MKQYLIIGNSAAGISAVEAIRKDDKSSKVTVVSDEEGQAYCRCLISYYLAGDVRADKIFYRPESFYRENNVQLFSNKRVTGIDVKKNLVTCADNSQLNYDSLLISTGASAIVPDVKGINQKGVFVFRTINDAKGIESSLPGVKTACVLGGGLVGLKAAYALRKRKLDVKIIVKSKQILSQMLDNVAAGLVQKRLESYGIEVIIGQDAAEIIGDGKVKAVKLTDNKEIQCSLVVAGRGVSPNIDLAKAAGIKVNKGIIADSALRTSAANIFCAGDVSETYDLALGDFAVNALWTMAVEQGKASGMNMSGGKVDYPGSIGMNATEFFSLPIVSLGINKIKEGAQGYEQSQTLDAKNSIYKKIILKGNFLVGAVLIGNIKNSGVLLRLIRERINVSLFKDELLDENFGFARIIDSVKERERIYV